MVKGMEKVNRKIALLKQLGGETERLLDDRCQEIFYKIFLSMPQGIKVNQLYREVKKDSRRNAFSRQSFFNHLHHLEEKNFITRKKDLKSKLPIKPVILKVQEDKWKIVGVNYPFSVALEFDERLRKALKGKPPMMVVDVFLRCAMNILSHMVLSLGDAKSEEDRALIFDAYIYPLALHVDYLWGRIKKSRLGWDKWSKTITTLLAHYAKDEKLATEFYSRLCFQLINVIYFRENLEAGKISAEEIEERLEKMDKFGPETKKSYEEFKRALRAPHARGGKEKEKEEAGSDG